MAEIIQAPASTVHKVWPYACLHLGPSIDMMHGCYDPEDVERFCEEGKMQLWLAFDGKEKLIGAVVTEIVDFPRRRAARVVFAGGARIKDWYGDMDNAVEEWARAWGCDALSAAGRRGWAKLTKSQDVGVLLWRDIESRELH